MKNWVYTCKNFKKVRNLIDEGEETSQNCLKILWELKNCCNELSKLNLTNWFFQDLFEDLKSEIQEDLALVDTNKYEDCEYFTNYYLKEFYDLCDTSCVWLGI